MKTRYVNVKFNGSGMVKRFRIPMGDGNPDIGDYVVTCVEHDNTYHGQGRGCRAPTSWSQQIKAGCCKPLIRTLMVAEVTDVVFAPVDLSVPYYLHHIRTNDLVSRAVANHERKDHAKRADEIKKQLDEKLKARDKMAEYERLAEHDPEAANLLRQLRTIY